jgi:class 3 adenylate cyclase/tetratricopeptide (TPR) repeat protein
VLFGAKNLDSKENHPLIFPVDINAYLPPKLGRALRQGQPKRRVLVQALNRLRSILYLFSTFIPSNLVQDKMKRSVPGLVGGELLRGSLLFADVSGFTALSEQLASLGPEGAERLTATMNTYFDSMLEIMSSSGGILLKFAGDAMLIYFPEQADNHQAVWAVRTGMRMLRSIKGFTSIKTPLGITSLQMKIGVSTGEFLAASVGSVKRMEYAVLGKTVSQTMSAESVATGPDQLVITQTTADYLPPTISFEKQAQDFYIISQNGQENLGNFEIKAEKRRSRGAIPFDANQQTLIDLMEDTLAQIRALRPYIADELVKRIIAHAQKRKVESEFLTATVLFCNFIGFDSLLEIWGPEGIRRVTNLLSAYFNAVSDVITRFGGIITRIDPYSQGTKLLALFGAPVSHQDDPLRAVRAAFMMNLELNVLNKRWRKKLIRHIPRDSDGPLIQHRIGVTVGKTYAGQVGSTTRREYTVMGDDVNLSARLMGAAKFGQILISQPVFEAVTDFFYCSQLAPIQVKGKHKPIAIYQADGPRSDTLLNRARQRSRLVGHEDEFAQGKKLLSQAFEGKCTTLTVQGSAGIGKSHLVDILLQNAISEGAEVITYQCNSFNVEIPYDCWNSVLRSLSGITITDSVFLRKEKLQRIIKKLRISQQHVPQLAKLVGLTGNDFSKNNPENHPEKVTGKDEEIVTGITSKRNVRRRRSNLDLLDQIEKKRTFKTSQMGFQIPSQLTINEQKLLLEAVSSLLTGALSEASMVLFIEDAHYLDAASRDLILHLQEKLISEPLLIILAQRSEFQQLPIGKTIHLTPLDDTATTKLVSEILVTNLAKIIYQHSNGNPLLIRQIANWIQQNWQINTADVSQALQSSNILQDLVLSSLEDLSENQREIIRAASVIGNAFSIRELQAILPASVDEKSLYTDLQKLVDSKFIALIETGIDSSYGFQQNLIQEVLYSSLPFARRRDLHTRLAEFLLAPETPFRGASSKVSEVLNPTIARNPVQNAKIITYHYEASKKWHLAAKSLLRVANLLCQQGAFSEVNKICDQALSDLENLPSLEIDPTLHNVKQGLLAGKGDAALMSGDYFSAISNYETAIGIRVDPDSSNNRANRIRKLALANPMVGKADKAKELLLELLDGDLKNSKNLAIAITLAWLYWRETKLEMTTTWLENCKAILPSELNSWEQGIAALLTDFSNQWESAITKYHAIGQPVGAALAAIRFGDQHLRGSDEISAFKCYESTLEIFSELGHEWGLALAHYRLAETAWHQRDIETSRSYLDQVESLLIACPAEIREEGRILVSRSLEIINAGKDCFWPNWRWQYYDDRFKISLLYRA